MRPVLSAPLVLGAGGFLGRCVEELLSQRFPSTVGATRAEIDITDYFGMLHELERLEPSLVINCAAVADVDLCERRPDLALRVNAEGAASAARASRAAGARFVHISTDYVFDGGLSRPYSENDPAEPRSVYGASKLDGERRVLKEHPNALVVRTSWLFGPGGGDFVERTLRLAREQGWVGGVTDQVSCPTHSPDLVAALEALAQRGAEGVVHFANSGACTRHELALRIVDLAGVGRDLQVKPQRWRELGLPAPRPPHSALSCARYTEITGLTPRPWEEALAELLAGGRESGRGDGERGAGAGGGGGAQRR
jgi:dTDP-4-dehydrorhamnose reductase